MDKATIDGKRGRVMTEIKLTKRYPQSRTEDIVDAYMRGWNDALDAVQNGKFIINDDRKTENCSEKPNNCDTCIWSVCNYNKVPWDTDCNGCKFVGWYDTDFPCVNCIRKNKDYYSPEQTETQTETQNSNLTFEKADERCKGCGHYKLTCDLFSEICRYEPKDEPQTELKGSKRLLKGKTEPQTCEECGHWGDTEDGCADRHGCRTTTEDWQDWKDKMWAEAIVTEPQKCSVNGRPYTDCCNCEYFKCTADEPQTERSE